MISEEDDILKGVVRKLGLRFTFLAYTPTVYTGKCADLDTHITTIHLDTHISILTSRHYDTLSSLEKLGS